MSQQPDEDDEATVIRPASLASGVAATVASPGPAGDAGSSDIAEDGISLRIGARVAEFEITRRIGEGGFSIVYLAMDRSLERTVALKEYLPSSLATRVGTTQVQPRSQRYRDTFEAGLKSFVNEAKLLAQFDHPSLVKVYRFWEANGTAYMVMPFYQGVTVKEAIRAMAGPPDEAWLLGLLVPLTEALKVIHAEHCYHRDIAPDNVILLASSGKPLLLDFGAARRVIGDMTQGLTVILKAGYAPVEQYAEIPGMKQGPWTDVYALAAVVYWAITGSTPPASVARMMSDSFVPLAKCASGRYSARFLQAIDRALVVRPEQRTQSIEALQQDLGLMGEGTAAPPAVRWDDSDATVIRPVDHGSRTATVTRREGQGDAGEQPTQAQSHAAAQRVSTDGGVAKIRPRRRAIALSAVAAAGMAAGGIWWALQSPVANLPRPATTGASPMSPTTEPRAAQGVADGPGPVEPAPGAQATLPSTNQTSADVPAAIAADASKPPPALPASAVESIPEPPRPAQKKSAPPVAAAPAESANRAECSRILQRLSLGETSAELMERLKALKCR